MKQKNELWSSIDEIPDTDATPSDKQNYITVTDLSPVRYLDEEFRQYFHDFNFYDYINKKTHIVTLQQVEDRIKRHKSLIDNHASLDTFHELFESVVSEDKRKVIDILDLSLVHVAGAQLLESVGRLEGARVYMSVASLLFCMFCQEVAKNKEKENASAKALGNQKSRKPISRNDPWRALKIDLQRLLNNPPGGGWVDIDHAKKELHKNMIDFGKRKYAKSEKMPTTDEHQMMINIGKWINNYEPIWWAYINNSKDKKK